MGGSGHSVHVMILSMSRLEKREEAPGCISILNVATSIQFHDLLPAAVSGRASIRSAAHQPNYVPLGRGHACGNSEVPT